MNDTNSQTTTPTPLDNQTAFDRAAAHLLRQGAQALNTAGKCCYLASDGRQCAVGALIPGEMYRPEMEGHTFKTLLYVDREYRWGVNALLADVNIFLLQDLQYCHDNNGPPGWPYILRDIAERHQLKPDVIDRTLAEIAATPTTENT